MLDSRFDDCFGETPKPAHETRALRPLLHRCRLYFNAFSNLMASRNSAARS
jgi:hypothetical protein